jgi:hypothetical protein
VAESSLLFSTPDNSDPSTNGRSYAVRERLGLSGGFGAAVTVLLVASLLLLARKRAICVLGGLSAAAAAAGIAGVLSYFDLITYDEYVSPAKVFHVIEDTYTFSISGNVAPFVALANVGAPTAIGVADELIRCETQPTLPAALSQSDRGGCAPRATGIDIDFALPKGVAEDSVPSFYRYPIRVHWYAVVGLFVLSAMLVLALRYRPTLRQALFGTGALVGGVGALLVAANIAGFLLPLRASMPSELVEGIRADGPRLPFEEGVKLLDWRDGDSPEGYARRANQAVFDSMIHGDVSTDLGRWRLEIPLWENWTLHTLGVMNPSLRKYRYWDHEKEFERGIGLCGNLSSVLVGYLAENGIPAKVVGLQGHVVVTAEVRPGVWYIFDPDYGVVIPHSLEQIESEPSLAEAAYRNGAKVPDAASLPMVVGYYATATDNVIDQSGREGIYYSVDESAEVYRSREQLVEILKWVVPPLMLAAGLAFGLMAFLWRRPRRERTILVESADSAPGLIDGGGASF